MYLFGVSSTCVVENQAVHGSQVAKMSHFQTFCFDCLFIESGPEILLSLVLIILRIIKNLEKEEVRH